MPRTLQEAETSDTTPTGLLSTALRRHLLLDAAQAVRQRLLGAYQAVLDAREDRQIPRQNPVQSGFKMNKLFEMYFVQIFIE